ncbi:MAG TPA: hypothetical protein VIJ22_07700, partial [Polyangiaceae bacterium]
MALLAALAAACLSAAHLGNVADAAHDAGVARAMGLEAQPWRALDAVVASVFAALPLGTRAARAGLGEAVVVGMAGAALFVVAWRLAAACADSPRLGALTAAIATLAAVCSPVWQTEAAAVAGSTTGALLALLPLAVLARADEAGVAPRWREGVFLLGLAVGYEPLVGACAFAALAALVGVGPRARRGVVEAWRTDGRILALCFVAGLGPLLLAVARTRVAGVPLVAALADGWAGERGASHAGSPAVFLRTELGIVLGALAAGGAVLSALVPRARALGAALLAVVVVGFASGWAGAPLGPTRFGAPVLAAMAAACGLAGAAMQAVVRGIAEAKVPLARASAAMVLVLELAIPVDSAD